MKVSFWTIGSTKSVQYGNLIKDYNKRLSHYLKYEYKEYEVQGKGNPERVMEMEKNRILKSLKPQDNLILWDVKGKELSSEDFADFMQSQMMSGQDLVFLIGGAYGFHPELIKIAKARISLSKMTFNHQMVRVIAQEQLYRAMTILRNEPYHNA